MKNKPNILIFIYELRNVNFAEAALLKYHTILLINISTKLKKKKKVGETQFRLSKGWGNKDTHIQLVGV